MCYIKFQGTNDNLKGQPLHALFQLSGALRTLAKIPQKEFCPDALATKETPSIYSPQPRDSASVNVRNANNLNSKTSLTQSQTCPAICETSDGQPDDTQLDLAGPHLVRAAEICIDELEVQANLIRTLSVLSEQDKCCDMLADMSARLGILLGPCPMTVPTGSLQERNAIVPMKPLGMLSRIGYIIGNIMAKSDEARIQVRLLELNKAADRVHQLFTFSFTTMTLPWNICSTHWKCMPPIRLQSPPEM